MAFADTQKLLVELSLGGNFTRQLSAAQKAVGGFDAKLSKTQGRAYKAGQQIGTGIQNIGKIAAVGLAALGSQVIFGLKQLAELETQTAQTNAVLKSTGAVAGQTAESVRALAEKYENLNATIDDKVIQSGENLLLTFTNIRKDAFEPTLQAALDMSTALGQDLNTSVLQLGKALSDPAKGLLALRRAGVIFSKDQEKRIKALQKEGKLYEAQKIILAEVAKEFGGSFAAGGKTAAGAIAGIGDAVEDLQKALATALFPTIQKVLPLIRSFLQSPQFIKGAEDLGAAIAGVFSDENIAAAGDIIKSVFATAQQAAPVVAAAAKTMAGFVQAAVGAFRSLPPELQQLAIGAFAVNKLTGGLVTNVTGALASGIIQKVLGSFSGGMNVTAGIVNVNGGVTPGGGGVPGGGGLGLVTKVFLVGAAAGVIAEAFQASGLFDPSHQVGPNGQIGRGTNDKNAQLQHLLAALPVLMERAAGGDKDAQRKLDQVNAQIALLRGEAASQASIVANAATQAGVRSAERTEAIRAEVAKTTAATLAGNAALQAGTTNTVSAADRTAAAVRFAGTSQVAATTSAKDAIAAATRKAGGDTAAEVAGVRRAVDAKKLNVDVKVVNNNKVSVQQIVKQTSIINKYTTIS